MMIRLICLASAVVELEAEHPHVAALLEQVAAHRVLDAVGLLEDLLEHEVLEAAALDRLQVPLDLVDRLVDPARREGADPVPLRGEHRHLAVVEVDHLPGVLDDRRLVGGDEELAVADAEDDRRAVARGHQHVGLVGRDDGDAVGTVDVAQRGGDGLLEVALVELADQVRQDLGVGVGGELVPPADECLAQVGGVLDDAVVDQRNATRLVDVRMGVGRGGRAVGGPAGVADAQPPVGHAAIELLGEHPQLPSGLAQREAVAVDHGDAGGVIAAVLHPPQSLHQDRRGLLRSHITHDATHAMLLLCAA